MKLLIVANWKCNPKTLKGANLLFNSIKRKLKKVKNIEVVICPPFVYLSNIKLSNHSVIKLGAQDCFWKNFGAFTGEISPLMLKDLNCKYIIIGHSERRKYFNESDEIINKKIKAVIEAKIKPILCIGETREEKEKGYIQKKLKSQIEKGLKRVPKKEIKNLIIAYEPIWAIGTGKPCDIKEAQTAYLVIKKIITNLYPYSISKNIKILYGGSVNSKNAKSYIKQAGMDGLLIGGASLNAQEFIKIVRTLT